MCKERYINPYTDFGFKRMFGTVASKPFLISFLNGLLEEEDPIVEITYHNPEKLGLHPGDRNAIFDLYCTTEHRHHIIVEMQNGSQRFFMDRSIYYSTFPIQEAAKVGDWDFDLPKVVTVALLNFRMPFFADSPEWKHELCLCDVATGKVAYDKLKYYYLEMPKFDKGLKDLVTTTDKWMYILKNINHMLQCPEELGGSLIESFFLHAEVARMDPEERMAYESSLKAMRDYFNTINFAREESLAEGRAAGLAEGKAAGLAEGRAEGAIEARLDVARLMLGKGMSLDEIVSLTGLPVDSIKALL
ncbi:MAG: Rpn family recombination-promoting nuclease/putative transposase [Bacteroidales bacterium]|nr:Rpn family recombination-promoting nuclease/putative transposase [Bacteroidales bacterium]